MPRISVKTDKPIPKDKIMEVMQELNKVLVKDHLKIGEIIIKNVLNTDANIVLAKDIK